MLSFLTSFTPSFLLAVLLWPFVAFFLTLPIFIFQYRKYNKLRFLRSAGIYLFIFYLLGLVCFTLYPLPENAAAFCQANHLTPQLNPLQLIGDIRSDGLRAISQVVMNFVFFVPLGVFLRLLLRTRIWVSLLVSFVASLSVETAQLTGVFGMYPCSYRLFDVDDLLVNTAGGVGGYLLATLLPRRELNMADKDDIVRKAGLVRYTVAFILDSIVSFALNVFVLLVLYLLIGQKETMIFGLITPLITVAVVYGLVPYIGHGWSLGGALVRLNHDDVGRSARRRVIYYMARMVFALLILALPNSWNWLSSLIVIATLIIWWKYKKLPYQFI